VEHATLVGYSILLVGHEPRTAHHMQRILKGAGAHICEARNLSDALACLATDEPSAAVLDYTRSMQASHQLPKQLTRLGIPFVFCKEIGRNEAWPQAPVLSNPVSDTDLIAVLRSLLRVEIRGPEAGPELPTKPTERRVTS
jgi:DNA-binding NtrC family response regulator